MSLKLKEEYRISSNSEDFIDDDFVVDLELSLFAFNVRREICGVLDVFLSFLKNTKKIKHITCCFVC
jgi:hypothetical protein